MQRMMLSEFYIFSSRSVILSSLLLRTVYYGRMLSDMCVCIYYYSLFQITVKILMHYMEKHLDIYICINIFILYPGPIDLK